MEEEASDVVIEIIKRDVVLLIYFTNSIGKGETNYGQYFTMLFRRNRPLSERTLHKTPPALQGLQSAVLLKSTNWFSL